MYFYINERVCSHIDKMVVKLNYKNMLTFYPSSLELNEFVVEWAKAPK